MQRSYSTLFGRDPYECATAAKAARDEHYRALRKVGIKARRWVLKDQLKPYESLGVPDGRMCDVYMLDIDVDSSDFEAVDQIHEITRL